MIGEVLVLYTFRHRYAKASHAAGIPLINITAAMGHTSEVHHQSYARFIPGGTADLYAKRNAKVPKYGKETQLAQILCSSSSGSPVPCNYSVFMDCVYRA